MKFKVGDILIATKNKLGTEATLLVEVTQVEVSNKRGTPPIPTHLLPCYVIKYLNNKGGGQNRLRQQTVENNYQLSKKHLRDKNLKKLLNEVQDR